MVRLYINYYHSAERSDEFSYCLAQNVACPYINEIICFSNDVSMVYEKVITIEGDRPTFQQFFDEINKRAGDDDISIISNLDIYFNDTLGLVHNIKHNEVFCITRWDLKDGKIKLFDTPDSQDSWVFRGKVREIANTDILMLAKWGVDNRLAWELQTAGYKVLNPSKSIQTIHVHASEVRPERTEHNVIPPPYLTLWTNFL